MNGHEYIGQHKWSRCDDYLPESECKTLQEQFYLAKGFHYFPIDPKYVGSGVALQHAIKKYGKDKFYILDILDIAYSKAELDELERQWIAHYRNTGHILYNISDGGGGTVLGGEKHPAFGTKRNPEQIKHLSESHMGEKNWNYGRSTPEHVKKKISAKLSGSGNPMYGKRGKDNPNFGKTYPSKGRIQSPEEREMRRIAHMTKCPDIRPPDCTGMIVINDGNINKKIHPEDLAKYPGWSRGMIRRRT